MRLYGIVKQSREEISSRLFSWQNFCAKLFSARCCRKDREPSVSDGSRFCAFIYPSILYERIDLVSLLHLAPIV